jgi:hypothetical protein
MHRLQALVAAAAAGWQAATGEAMGQDVGLKHSLIIERVRCQLCWLVLLRVWWCWAAAAAAPVQLLPLHCSLQLQCVAFTTLRLDALHGLLDLWLGVHCFDFCLAQMALFCCCR